MASYDFVIVGGGTAGLVLARRLSEGGKHTVLVLEAGRAPTAEQSAIVKMTVSTSLCDSSHDVELTRQYPTPPQPALNGRSFDLQTGWCLGGSSNVNFALWTRGAACDYARIADITGDALWNFDAIISYFKKAETYHAPERGRNGLASTIKTELHGTDGPVHVRPIDGVARTWQRSEDCRQAYMAAGMEYREDGSDGFILGIGEMASSDWFAGGGRQSSQAYVTPRPEKLEILENKQVGRVIFEGKSAVGVECISGEIFIATKEVILSAGALQSPAILQRSGIGPADMLQNLNIPLVHDLPGVGQNLWDHFMVSLRWRLKQEYTGGTLDDIRDPALRNVALQAYVQNGGGMLGGPPFEFGLWRNFNDEIKEVVRDDKTLSPRTRDYLLSPSTPHAQFLHVHGYVFAPDSHPPTRAHISILPIVATPTSRGTVRITSSDPSSDPIVDPNWLATDVDRTIVRAGMRFADKVMSNATFVETEVSGEEDQVGFESDEKMDYKVSKNGSTVYHFAGTCAMASPNSTEVLPVLNSQCEVYGVQRLRVVDMSAYPAPISANTQAPTYALAEKIADVIRTKYADA
ncbi:alcohol oxidase [Coniophora puteana RWD-64-598 SS2]|uniref:Alcohol oxidase n=1 Tax=Coniophora puteana (strain RWD-64-598) TaxID=741705 RepID=A0A5M3N131_CONPW|nr:alcohol oxidase [Coniophora puteana RWD-64-598 SS2]EIW84714.1 alcohol oxidase [Coniophora puteana RWD-64-598 SS2]